MASSPIRGRDDSKANDNTRGTGSISRVRQRDREAKTLYDYLGASPKDTQEQLKIRYTTLVKTLHPDSNPDKDTQNFYYDLSDINAAWEVLKDPEERKRYDREMQTKEITEGIESLVTIGLESFANNAIPFLQKTAVTTAAAMQKTAVTTAAAVDASTKAAKEVNEQAKTAYGVFEIEKLIKELEQKSNADLQRASRLEKDLVALPNKKIPILAKKSLQQKQQQQQQQILSSGEAQKILRNFQTTTTTSMKLTQGSLTNDIKLFTDTEAKQKDATTACQSAERAKEAAARKVEQAQIAEVLAKKRFEDAQKAFQEAKKNHITAQDVNRKASADERIARQANSKLDSQLEKTRDKVRSGLLQQQDAFLVSRAKDLKNEILECERSSNNYLKEAKALRIKLQK